MRTLRTEEIFQIIEKGLKKEFFGHAIGDLRFLYIDWELMQHNSKENYYWLDCSKENSTIMAYHNGYSEKAITIGQIKKYINQKFDGCEKVVFELKIPITPTLHLCRDREEFLNCIELEASIFYEEPKLDVVEIKEMIDLALKMNNKEWFNELVEKYNTYTRRVQ